MDGAAGEASDAALRVTFDPRLKLEFHGSKVTSDAGLLPFRDLDDALGLMDLAGEALADTKTGQNSRHTLIAQLRQSVLGRLAGYEDVNDAVCTHTHTAWLPRTAPAHGGQKGPAVQMGEAKAPPARFRRHTTPR